jgi:hypothetical protein
MQNFPHEDNHVVIKFSRNPLLILGNAYEVVMIHKLICLL